MSGCARREVVREGEIGVYHCWSKCVQAAFLCGFDHKTGIDFDYRRQWIEDLLKYQAAIFAIDVGNFNVLSNHIHLIARTRPDIVATWSDEEVAWRWKLAWPNFLGDRWVREVPPQQVQELLLQPDKIQWIRGNLSSLSWFMARWKEPIARLCNAEAGVDGHFWGERFGARELLDDAAVLGCHIYIDLNQVKATMAGSLEESLHSGIYARIRAAKAQEAAASLEAFAAAEDTSLFELPPETVEALFADCWLAPISQDGPLLTETALAARRNVEPVSLGTSGTGTPIVIVGASDQPHGGGEEMTTPAEASSSSPSGDSEVPPAGAGADGTDEPAADHASGEDVEQQSGMAIDVWQTPSESGAEGEEATMGGREPAGQRAESRSAAGTTASRAANHGDGDELMAGGSGESAAEQAATGSGAPESLPESGIDGVEGTDTAEAEKVRAVTSEPSVTVPGHEARSEGLRARGQPQAEEHDADESLGEQPGGTSLPVAGRSDDGPTGSVTGVPGQAAAGSEFRPVGDRQAAAGTELPGVSSSPPITGPRASDNPILTMPLDQYLVLVRTLAAELLQGGSGAIAGATAVGDGGAAVVEILERHGLDPPGWFVLLEQLEHTCRRALGAAHHMTQRAQAASQQWFRGIGLCRVVFRDEAGHT